MTKPNDSKIPEAPDLAKPGTTTESEKAFDPFDPENLKLTDADRADLGVTPVIVEMPSRKPKKQEWIRTHPDRVSETALFKLEESGEFYLVVGEARGHAELLDQAKPFRVQLAMNRAGSAFLWPAQVPEEDGAGASWHRSGINCQRKAEGQWLRIVSDRAAGCYVPRVTQAKIPEPKWPDMSMRDLMELCFGARVIDSPDHPVIKMLAGEE